MPLVLSDSSSLIHLAAIERLSLLKEIFQEIAIPCAVWMEVVELGNRRAGTLVFDHVDTTFMDTV